MAEKNMIELRTLSLPLPPVGSEWGAIRLPFPMTEEQWQAFEAYIPMLKIGFVRQPSKEVAPTEAGATHEPTLATQPDSTKA
jgi:hypothetical protein